MAKQISKTAIGGFVISALALLVIGVLVFGSGKFFKETQKFVLFFEGSVKGLREGSAVVFRGVEIGSVEVIVAQVNPKKLDARIITIISLEPDRVEVIGEELPDMAKRLKLLIDRGLRAQLVMESFVTGQLMVALDFHPDKPIRLVSEDMGYPEIPTISTTVEELEQIIKKVPIEEIFTKLLSAIDGIEKVLAAPELLNTIRNLDQAVQNAVVLFKDADRLILGIDNQVDPLAESIKSAFNDANRLINNADKEVATLSNRFQQALHSVQIALDQASATLASVESVTEKRSEVRHKLNLALGELAGAGRSVRALADYLERHPESLLQGKK